MELRKEVEWDDIGRKHRTERTSDRRLGQCLRFKIREFRVVLSQVHEPFSAVRV